MRISSTKGVALPVQSTQKIYAQTQSVGHAKRQARQNCATKLDLVAGKTSCVAHIMCGVMQSGCLNVSSERDHRNADHRSKQCWQDACAWGA
jgi:hypothetical protein